MQKYLGELVGKEVSRRHEGNAVLLPGGAAVLAPNGN